LTKLYRTGFISTVVSDWCTICVGSENLKLNLITGTAYNTNCKAFCANVVYEL